MRSIVLFCVLLPTVIPNAAADEIIPLFRGDTFDLWTAQNGGPVKAGWQVRDGIVHFDPKRGAGGNILTAAEYGDFELSFDFRIGERGNSGIKYRVRKYGNRLLGCEYQILDDPAYGQLKPTQFTASLYDIKEPSAEVYRPGEFNSGRIVVADGWIEHWLNARLVVSTYVGSRDWVRRVDQSKFRDVSAFSENATGRLMLTDHNSEVWYRNVVLRVVGSKNAAAVASDCRGACLTRPVCCQRRSCSVRRRCR